ncbi:hypothetical protein AbraIFM66950_008274 [Aspergillus brasiliensis]|nr:hypothetical protein AbraIFM66950_008274 [Aspergillus brasiliensis]
MMPSTISQPLSLNIPSALDAYQMSAATYISLRPSEQLVGILCASVIIHDGRVLLLQRAAHDDYPSLWEVPGGVAHDSETIIDCALRELWEETGFQASAVTNLLGEFAYDDSSLPPKGSSDRGKWKIFVFRVIVDDKSSQPDVRLDPTEHTTYLWATEEEVKDDSCGSVKLDWISVNQKKAILKAFKEAEH